MPEPKKPLTAEQVDYAQMMFKAHAAEQIVGVCGEVTGTVFRVLATKHPQVVEAALQTIDQALANLRAELERPPDQAGPYLTLLSAERAEAFDEIAQRYMSSIRARMSGK